MRSTAYLQSLRTAGGLVGGTRDVLQQLQEGGALLDALFEVGLPLRQHLLGLLAHGDILDGQQKQRRVGRRAGNLASIQEHRLRPDGGEVVIHLKVLEGLVLRQHLCQPSAQRGNVPCADAHRGEQAALRLRGGDMEEVVERPIRRAHTQGRIEDQQGVRTVATMLSA